MSADTITRTITVNRNRTPQKVLKATGRLQHVNETVLATMPKGEGEEVDVVFFTLGRWISDPDLSKEYELRGLVPDPYAQAAVNEQDPSFADEHPNGTHWQRKDGGWNFLSFYRWLVEDRVSVSRRDDDWRDGWWFGGVRKPA